MCSPALGSFTVVFHSRGEKGGNLRLQISLCGLSIEPEWDFRFWAEEEKNIRESFCGLGL